MRRTFLLAVLTTLVLACARARERPVPARLIPDGTWLTATMFLDGNEIAGPLVLKRHGLQITMTGHPVHDGKPVSNPVEFVVEDLTEHPDPRPPVPPEPGSVYEVIDNMNRFVGAKREEGIPTYAVLDSFERFLARQPRITKVSRGSNAFYIKFDDGFDFVFEISDPVQPVPRDTLASQLVRSLKMEFNSGSLVAVGRGYRFISPRVEETWIEIRHIRADSSYKSRTLGPEFQKDLTYPLPLKGRLFQPE